MSFEPTKNNENAGFGVSAITRISSLTMVMGGSVGSIISGGIKLIVVPVIGCLLPAVGHWLLIMLF